MANSSDLDQKAPTARALVLQPTRRSRSAYRELASRMFARKINLVALVILALSGVLIGAGPIVFTTDPLEQNIGQRLARPSVEHPLGRDELGRDVFIRVLHGGRSSLAVAFAATFSAAAVGTVIGLMTGFLKGWYDAVIMRIMDGLLAIPGLVLAIALSAFLGPEARNAMIAIAVVIVPFYARLVRGATLSVAEHEYVTAARALGSPTIRILFTHIWPNVTAPVIVQASLTLGAAIIIESSLSFLGLGIQPPDPTWGNMMQRGFRFLATAPWLTLAPGVTISVVVLSINFLGDGLRDTLDPRLRGTR